MEIYLYKKHHSRQNPQTRSRQPYQRGYSGRKILEEKVQNASPPLGPRELAIKVRNALKNMNNSGQPKRDGPHNSASYLIPKPAYEIDPLTQQNPGVRFTTEEKNLANSGDLEYTFHVEFNIMNGSL